MFRPVTARPDFVAQEHELLREWRERRTFARLRAQNAGNARWSFLDGPITANNPMGVHHAWGRTYKDLYQRFHAMLGEDQRYQNGFDCQGLWVEVNVERDLGFTTKRDIEPFGIAEFVEPVQAARPDLRRPPDRADHPARQLDGLERPGRAAPAARPARGGPDPAGDDRGPGRSRHRHGRDARRAARHAGRRRLLLHVQQREQRPHLGLPRRVPPARLGLQGPRHDAVVPALRDRPLPDGDERGLRRPRGPGADRPLPAARPARRVAPRLDDDALDAGRQRRRGRRRGPALRPGPPGRRRLLARQGDAQAGPPRPVPGPGRGRRRRSWSAGATPGRSTSCRPWPGPSRRPATSTASSPGTEVGEEEGTGIVHIAPGCGAEDFQLGRELGLPVIGPIDEDGRYYHGLRLADRARGAQRRRGDRRATSSSGASSTTSRPYSHRYPHCWRCGTPLLFRLVDEWYISMGAVYDQPRDQLTKEEVDASLRYQIMDVVDRIRWIPAFGYERELDWLLNMHDWMISKKRYWGLALPIYDCAACGHFDVIGGREELEGAGGRGLGRVRGPHAAPAVRRRGQDRLLRLRRAGLAHPGRRQPLAGRRHRAVLDAALPRGPGVLGEVVPGRLHHRELPGPVPQLVLRDARDEHGAAPRGAVPDDLRLRDAVRRGRPADAQELGQRDRVRRGGRADGRRRHALDVRVRAARRQHPVRLARGRRGAPRPAGPVERLRVLRHLRAPGRLDARDRARRRSPSGRRSTAGSCRGRPPWPPRSRRSSATTTPRPRPASCPPTSTTCRRGTCGCRAGACRARRAPTATRRSRRSTRRSSRWRARSRRSCRSSRRRSTGTSWSTTDPAAPDSVHLTAVAGRRAGAAPRRGAGGGDGGRAQGRRPVADAARRGRPQDAPAAGPPLARAARPRARRAGRAARAGPRRGQRQGRRADRRRVGARGPRRQGAPAEGRQAARARRSRR